VQRLRGLHCSAVNCQGALQAALEGFHETVAATLARIRDGCGSPAADASPAHLPLARCGSADSSPPPPRRWPNHTSGGGFFSLQQSGLCALRRRPPP
jgi:hypothetical protein